MGPWRGSVSAALLGLLACAIVSPWMPAMRWPLTWAAIPLVFAASFGSVAWLLAWRMSPWSLLAVEGWVLGAGIVYLSVSSYDEVRDGANEVAWLLYGASLATFLAILCLIREHKNPIRASDVVDDANRSSLSASFLDALGPICACDAMPGQLGLEVAPGWTEASPRESSGAHKPIRAGDAHVGNSNRLDGVLERALRQGHKDKAGIRSMFPVFHRDEIIQQRASEAIAFAENYGRFVLDEEYAQKYLDLAACPKGMAPNDYFQAVLVWSATPAFPLVLVVLSTGIFLLLLWLLPSFITERKPPRGSDNASSRRLGRGSLEAWMRRSLSSYSRGAPPFFCQFCPKCFTNGA